MAKTRILISAENVWKYYSEHVMELKKTAKLVACDEDLDIEIHITDECGILCAMVYLKSVEVASEEMIDYPSAKETMMAMYQEYIYNAEEFIKQHQQEIDESDEEDMIDERENEMDDAVYDLLTIFCGSAFDFSSKETQEVIEDVKDIVCEMLFENHGIEVYRPMYLADDNGNEEFCLYPYAELAD